MKFKNYVAIVRNNTLHYVTAVDNANKTAHWTDGKAAKAMTQTVAQDLIWALRCNGYPAVLVKFPDYQYLTECLRIAGAEGTLSDLAEDPVNPIPEDWFGVTGWCDEDIASGLIDEGYEADPEVVRKIRGKCSRLIHEAAVETGWDVIAAAIRDLDAEELTPIGKVSDR